jgi:hypothetical protein
VDVLERPADDDHVGADLAEVWALIIVQIEDNRIGTTTYDVARHVGTVPGEVLLETPSARTELEYA